jgi:hypothetical protein
LDLATRCWVWHGLAGNPGWVCNPELGLVLLFWVGLVLLFWVGFAILSWVATCDQCLQVGFLFRGTKILASCMTATGLLFALDSASSDPVLVNPVPATAVNQVRDVCLASCMNG